MESSGVVRRREVRMRCGFMRRGTLWAVALVVVLSPRASRAIDLAEGRIQIHGYAESQIRLLNPNLNTQWNLSAWRNVLRIETEIDLAPKGFLFFDAASWYSRLEVSYDCVWTHACGLFPSAAAYGDRTELAPSYYMTGHRNGWVGDDPTVNPFNGNSSGPARSPGLAYSPGGSNKLAGFQSIPGIEVLALNASFAQTFAPYQNDQFAIHQLSVSQTTSNGDSSGLDALFGLWRPKDDVQNNAALIGVPNQTTALPLRPLVKTLGGVGRYAGGLYAPSPAVQELYMKGVPFNNFDQNFSQSALAWNHGASQDTHELQQAYLDLSTLEGRLSLRIGRQAIIWGKTELFRNTDQINPSDFAVATLPTLDESRISLWAARAIYSLYDVGPLQDVRAELVWILDRFMPNDLGRCGEPYSPLPVCTKQSQLFLHGALGAGLVGETRPPNWWNSLEGNQLGARFEFRWDRFSFAVTDYYHYDQAFNAQIIQSYSRKVDPFTGRPLANSAPANASCTTGTESACLRPGTSGVGNALTDNPQNRQLFDVICSSSVGFFAADPTGCALTLTNSSAPLGGGAFTVSQLVSAGLAGSPVAQGILKAQLAPISPTSAANFKLVQLNKPPIAAQNTPGAGLFGATSLNSRLTVEQQALLGCGPFYQTSCDTQGTDVFNGEASVLFQTWPGNNPGNQVATRFVNGHTVILPGARGPGDPGYNPLVDGCVTRTPAGCAIPGNKNLVNPFTGNLFQSVMAALSFNALEFLTALDLTQGNVPQGCDVPTASNPLAPLHCKTIQDFYSVTGTTRPDVKAGGNGLFGRRDFVWAGAGELLLQYQKVNTLGLAMDFAEDRTATNWGIEFSWTPNGLFSNSETSNGVSNSDRFDLTISIDRPTFVNFLNSSRTFFFNMQWFLEYLSSYQGGYPRGFQVNGPFTALGTFTIQTGYFQDRLQPALTFVYDVATASGGISFETAFRFTSNFSLTMGMNGFYGQPQSWSQYLALGAIGESSQRWTTEKFDRLNAVRERDEVFARLRYTF